MCALGHVVGRVVGRADGRVVGHVAGCVVELVVLQPIDPFSPIEKSTVILYTACIIGAAFKKAHKVRSSNLYYIK